MSKPRVVCLCGSTRFMDAFFDEGWRETLEGRIVLSVGVCKHAEDHGGEALGPGVAAREQRDIVAEPHQLVYHPGDHTLGAAVELWRHAFGKRSELGDAHSLPGLPEDGAHDPGHGTRYQVGHGQKRPLRASATEDDPLRQSRQRPQHSSSGSRAR